MFSSVWIWVCCAVFAQGKPPPSPGLVVGFHRQAQAVYAQLGGEYRQYVFDTTSASDTLWAPPGATTHRLERETRAAWKPSEVLAVIWLDASGKRVRRELRTVRTVRKEWVGLVRTRQERGTSLDSTQLDWTWRDTSTERDTAVRAAQLLHLRLRRMLHEGQMVRSASVEPRPVALKGARVALLVGQGTTHIETQVELLEDAYMGRRVRCRGPFGNEIKGQFGGDGVFRGL